MVDINSIQTRLTFTGLSGKGRREVAFCYFKRAITVNIIKDGPSR